MRKYWIILVLLLLLHLFFLTQLRFTVWPEMFSFPYLKNNGYLLYMDMVHAYPPLLTLVLAAIYKIFGYNLWVLQAVTWAMLLANDLLIFVVSKKISKSTRGALLSVAAYVLLQPFLEGNQMWFDFAITTPLLLGLFFIINKKYLWAAFFVCFAAFTKQTGGLFFIAYITWLVFSKKKPETFVKAALMPLVFMIPFGVRLLQEGAVQGFLNWVILYPSRYWTKFPGYIDMNLGRRELVILLLIVLPAVALLLKKKAWLLLIFCAIGIASIYPRFSFFHFQTALPFFAISYSFLNKIDKKKLVIIFVAFFVIAQQYIYKPAFAFDWQKSPRFWSDEEFLLAQKIPREGKIYFLGYHSANYVMSQTLPPKPWVDSYPWVFEIPDIQEQTLQSWENNPPVYIFWQPPQAGNWYDIGTYQPQKITEWIKQNYIHQKNNLWKRKD